MRIAMLCDLYKPYISGVTNHISLLKKVFEKSGHEVFVFTFGDEDYDDDEANVIRSSGFPLPVPSSKMEFHLNLRYSTNAQNMIQSMDILHAHHPFLSGQLALHYGRLANKPVVFTNHTRYDLYYKAYLPWMPEALGESFLRSYMPSFCQDCDMVIAPSEGMHKVLMHLGVHSPIEVVPNGVDLQPILQTCTPFDRHVLDFSEKNVVLIFVGRLGPEKNLPFLLRSFAGVIQAFENVRLLVIGDGPEYENLEDRVKLMGIEEFVKFTGMVPYNEIPAYLIMADAFVTASVTEVHPLTIIEAMAASLPVLGIDSPGVGDTIIDGETGFLSSDDIATFTAKMIRLVTDEKLRKHMAEKAKQLSSLYAIESTSQILLDKYNQVITEKQTSDNWFYKLIRKATRN